jgi:hypothetical protein
VNPDFAILLIGCLAFATLAIVIRRTRINILLAKLCYYGILGGLGAGLARSPLLKLLLERLGVNNASELIADGATLIVSIPAVMLVGVWLWPKIAGPRADLSRHP